MNSKCIARHTGIWAIEASWFQGMYALWAGGRLPEVDMKALQNDEDHRAFSVSDGGIARIPVTGQMTKGRSKMGEGTSSVDVRHMLKSAATNPDVKGILMHIDSPGGTVAGMDALNRSVRMAKTMKPVNTHVDDLGASAAYWLASQGDEVSAGPLAEVGGIGVFTVVQDTSGVAERQGVKVHVVGTGEHKGAGIPGTEITKAQLASIQARVDDVNDIFTTDVAMNRNLELADVQALADGSVMISHKAQEAGLVDHVRSVEDTLQAMEQEIAQGTSAEASMIRRAARAKIGR